MRMMHGILFFMATSLFNLYGTELYSSLPETVLQSAQPVDWSILICTLDERAESFTQLYQKLMHQIASCNLQEKVEILFFKDNREHSVGYKRNMLMAHARGEYVNYVDDDDDIHDEYVSMIYEKLLKKPDCVSLLGIIVTNGQDPHLFVHSAKYTAYFTHEGVYYRPPNHLNPMKKSIAQRVQFPDLVYGEDYDWTMRVNALGLFVHEEEINTPYYLYQYDGKYDRPGGKKS